MKSPRFAGNAPARVLVSCPQRIGDVLLTTPLVRSMKRAWPETRIDVLVFQGTEGAIEGNADIAEIITVPRSDSFAEKLRLFRRLWRQYDLAVAPIPTDRARIYGWVAGRYRIGYLGAPPKRKSATKPTLQERFKKLLLSEALVFDDLDTHTVTTGLRLAEALGIAPVTEVVPPSISPYHLGALRNRLDGFQDAPFAVLHPYPKFRYKMWPQDAWIALGNALMARGSQIVLTGSADPAEVSYANEIAAKLPAGVLNMAGTLSLAETAEIIRLSKLYVGPDTAVTHIAAATGVPVVTLFGPSNPVKWGPWPHGWTSLTSPWARRGSGRRGNVILLQGPGDCVPCMLEGCERHINSRSDCLDKLGVGLVLDAVNVLLSDNPRPEDIAFSQPGHHVISLHHERH
ncbi:MAG: glycosyltransferase family 9 protein [Betaproteobacteria bacterium]